MASQQLQLYCDDSVLANFKNWAQAISNWFSTLGWTQTADTGQVNWSTVTAPTSGVFVYEIWQPPAGLTAFYVKMEYGNSGTNVPNVRITIGTGTNGAGTITGYVIGSWTLSDNPIASPSTTTQYECNFSGSGGNRIAVMLWRNSPSANQMAFAIERSLNGSGAYTGDHVTLITVGNQTNSRCTKQGTILFGVGVGPTWGASTVGGSPKVIGLGPGSQTTLAFNNSISTSPVFPDCGGFQNPLTSFACGMIGDFAEGVQQTMTLYGSTVNYIFSKNFPFQRFGAYSDSSGALFAMGMRYD